MTQIDTTSTINAVRLVQQGSNPASPAASHWLLFIKSDGLYIKDSAGNVTGPFGTGAGIATDAIWDAKGDLAIGTGSNTAARLAVGTNDYVLTAASGETTGVKWAAVSASGGRTLISEQTPTGTGTCTFSSIAATYKRLTLEFVMRSTDSNTEAAWRCFVNNDTTDANYRRQRIAVYGSGVSANAGASDAAPGSLTADTAPAGYACYGEIVFVSYASTTYQKGYLANFSYQSATDSVVRTLSSVHWLNTAAINRIDVVLAAGNFKAGSELRLYGET